MKAVEMIMGASLEKERLFCCKWCKYFLYEQACLTSRLLIECKYLSADKAQNPSISQ